MSARGSATFRARTSKADLSAIPLLNSIVSPSRLSSIPGARRRIFVTGACKIFKLFAGDNSGRDGTEPYRRSPKDRWLLHRNSSNFGNYEPRCGNSIILKGGSDFANATNSADANIVRARTVAGSLTYLRGRQWERKSYRKNENKRE